MFHRYSCGLLLLVMVSLGITGCDPLTRDRFDMIVVNVSDQYEVRKTLGEPTYAHAGQWHFERPDKHLNVLVDFSDAGLVSRKQWIDAATNEWNDSAEGAQSMTSDSTRLQTKK